MKPLGLTNARPLRSTLGRPLASLRKLAPALLLSLAPLLGAGQTAVVHAASGDCTTSGSQVTCTFSYTGAEQSWQVPAGVSSVQVTAIGGSGSSNVTSDGTCTRPVRRPAWRAPSTFWPATSVPFPTCT
jgi:hypothetical protein